MADNITVLNSASSVITLRTKDVGGGVECSMSIPTNTLGTAIIGQSVMATSMSVVIASDQTAVPVTVSPTTIPNLLSVAAVSGAVAAVAIKAAAGTLWGINLYCNNTTNPVFLKIYNSTAAGVSVGSTIPKFTVGIPPGDFRDVALPQGASLTTAMSYAITKLIGDTDATAVGTDDVRGIITYV